jgi:sulfhydrogenase subunit beta (sulfur reductase)
MQYILKKGDFNSFAKKVMSDFEFIAPTKGDESKRVLKTQFSSIKNPKDIELGVNTYFPAKYFFFDKKETLLNFKGNILKDVKIKVPQRVIFGLKKCDLNGIMHQDTVFLDENVDPFYKKRRDATVLIGVHCKAGDEYCFCNSLELTDFHDLMFYEKEDVYAVETGSEKGEKFIKKFSSFFEEMDTITDDDRKTENTLSLHTTDIKDMYGNEGWKELADTCLSCGACNNLCPNCHCFTIQDEVEFDLKTGKRVRVPASCQLRSFTRVAGDHVFRDERTERYKHRIYHQIQYFKDRHDVVFCTGCGRCVRGCPAKIDWVAKINEMKSS